MHISNHKFCKESEYFENLLKKDCFNKKEKQFLKKVFTSYQHLYIDVEYYKYILSGEHSSSIDILTNSLDKAQKNYKELFYEKNKNNFS